MKAYRIGVLADTHVPQYQPSLPGGVMQTLADVDLIFHLGNITEPYLLRDLSRIAPVVAVRGDHDTLTIPRRLIVSVAGIRIGLVHGTLPLYRRLPSPPSPDKHASRQQAWNNFLLGLERAFKDSDAILFGHQRPHMAWQHGKLLFSPGAVYHPTLDMVQAELAKNPPLLRRLALQRWLAAAEKEPAGATMSPSVGILTIADGKIQAELLSISAASPLTPIS